MWYPEAFTVYLYFFKDNHFRTKPLRDSPSSRISHPHDEGTVYFRELSLSWDLQMLKLKDKYCCWSCGNLCGVITTCPTDVMLIISQFRTLSRALWQSWQPVQSIRLSEYGNMGWYVAIWSIHPRDDGRKKIGFCRKQGTSGFFTPELTSRHSICIDGGCLL